MSILKFIFGYCAHCGRWFKYPIKRIMNTRYEIKENNYIKVCCSCFIAIEILWKEQWDDYHSGQ